MTAAVVIILNPKTRPQSAAIGSNTRSFEVDIPDNPTDEQVFQAVLAQLESEQE